MHEVLTPKFTQEELVRRLEILQAQCAELLKLARKGMVAEAEGKVLKAEHKLAGALTPRMVAERWATSERHVRNLICRGELRHFRVGGKLLRIAADAVEEFEARHAVS
jgi:excisionase family DNA binding protein